MKELASAASVGAHKCLCKQYYFCMVSSCILDKVCMHATGKVCKLILYLCMYEPITAHLLCWWMCVCVCVCVYTCGPCVFSEPPPTITVSVHYSLWAAKIIINKEQRWAGGNERLEEQLRLTLLGQIKGTTLHLLSPSTAESDYLISYSLVYNHLNANTQHTPL